MNIKLIPTKELYRDWASGYRVLSCLPSERKEELTLNKYGNFTLAGSNLNEYVIGNEYDLSIRVDQKAKYPASYAVIGMTGVETDAMDNIVISHEAERQILSRLMEKKQVDYCLEAYPDFAQMVLRGQEGELDYKKIYNVGKVRIESYIDKIKADCRTILFMPLLDKWGIAASNDINTLVTTYESMTELKTALEEHPYKVLVGQLEWRFAKADAIILENEPQFKDSQHRCEYACVDYLKKNEEEGNTRINANVLYGFIKEATPECVQHIVPAVTDCEAIHYDTETKYAALTLTYKAEQTIADNIIARLKNPTPTPMNWEEFKSVDGFEITNEQAAILQLVCDYNAMMLTGSAGTGKTSSMKALIRMLEANGHTYTLLAPTGVAAKRLREATGRRASTIHMNLARQEEIGEFLVLEESSMLSVHLLAQLLLKVPSATKIIFVCDEAQLASISCGNIVQDLIDSGVLPRANLSKVFRYGIGGIATVATDIRNGSIESLDSQFDDYTFTTITDSPIEQVCNRYGELLSLGYKHQDILILCPYNKSCLGTYTINKAIQERFNPDHSTGISYKRDGALISFNVGDRVINTKNNYHVPHHIEEWEDIDETPTTQEMAVMNGDIGIIRNFTNDDTNVSLVVEFDNGLADISGGEIQNLLLGYAISVHKVQGAQAKAVIVVMNESHTNLLSRNLLYVAVSRAQKNLTLISNTQTLKEGLKECENKTRDTWLKDMLKKEKKND